MPGILAQAAAPGTGICVECGATFTYRRRGIPATTCTDACRTDRRRRQAQERFARWRDRQAAA